MKPIISEWTKNLKTEKEKKEFEDTLRNSHFVLSRLREIIQQRTKDTESEADYASPSWAYLQAHRNGMKQENRQILKLLEFIE